MNFRFVFLLLFSIASLSLKSQVAELPFKIDNGHIIIKIKDGGGIPRNFVFDTGSEPSVLDIKVARKMKLEADGEVEVTGGGSKKSLEYVSNQMLYLSKDITLKSIHFILSDLSRLNPKYEGIIGYDMLKRYVVQIDYTSQKLVLFRKAKSLDLDDYAAIPFKFDNDTKIPQFDISLTLENGKRFKGPVLFDTGAGLTLSVSQKFVNSNKIMDHLGKTAKFSGKGLHKPLDYAISTIAGLQLNRFSLGKMTIRIPESDSGVFSTGSYLGILGNNVISRFHIILDYRKKMLYLKPNARFEDSFEFPSAGIELRTVGSEIVVGNIILESAAYGLGLRRGDRIISVNGNSSNNVMYTKKRYHKLAIKPPLSF
ncbi:aspartyl protease family protein [Maribacter sp. 2210JD10-5]|uniref:aspartyl protease family protein n=1 Tax=Maribacter sp. 2210JD10-5 TaxID=3386272 RepID=UPI0039BCD8BC